jgi:hypothetical protein
MPPNIAYAPVKSGNIKEVGYDPASRTLGVRFHSGATYHYADVSAEKHAALMAAPSVGSHLHSNIKGAHASTKVDAR